MVIASIRHKTNIRCEEQTELVEIGAKNQLFQFDGQLYEQVDSVAMGSSMGPIMATAVMCLIEEKFQKEGKIPSSCKCHVTDPMSLAANVPLANKLHQTLNSLQRSFTFTMKLQHEGKVPFLSMFYSKYGQRFSTEILKKSQRILASLQIIEMISIKDTRQHYLRPCFIIRNDFPQSQCRSQNTVKNLYDVHSSLVSRSRSLMVFVNVKTTFAHEGKAETIKTLPSFCPSRNRNPLDKFRRRLFYFSACSKIGK